MTGPNQPTPRPLPNPGPPPAPSGCVETTQPGPGPKPEGPTGPTPTGPGRQADCDCGHGDLDEWFHLAPCPRATPLRIPTLGMVIRDAERTLTQAINTLGRQWDPTSGPSQQDDPWGAEVVDIHLGSAAADIRSALRELADLTKLGLPPSGSAVMFPARQAPSACLSGGSASHPSSTTGEGLSPGLDTGLRRPDNQSERPMVGPLAGASHLAAAGGGRTPGLVDSATPTDESGAVAPGRDAGASSGFTLPVTERFTMPGTERIARSINEALTGQSW